MVLLKSFQHNRNISLFHVWEIMLLAAKIIRLLMISLFSSSLFDNTIRRKGIYLEASSFPEHFPGWFGSVQHLPSERRSCHQIQCHKYSLGNQTCLHGQTRTRGKETRRGMEWTRGSSLPLLFQDFDLKKASNLLESIKHKHVPIYLQHFLSTISHVEWSR